MMKGLAKVRSISTLNLILLLAAAALLSHTASMTNWKRLLGAKDDDFSSVWADFCRALEKAGILKAGVPAVVGPMEPEPAAVVRARAAELGAPLDVFGRDLAVERVSVGVDGTRFRYLSDGWADGLQVRTRLVGQHQAPNSSVTNGYASQTLSIVGTSKPGLLGSFSRALAASA